MKTYQYTQLTDSDIQKLCQRPRIDFASIFKTVQPILEQVQNEGDKAIIDLTEKFDGVRLSESTTNVDSNTTVALDDEIKNAFDTAYQNIYNFHMAQRPNELVVETMPGVLCRREARPIERVGLYVPGGSAILPSTALMLGVPAKIAGCREIVLATPPKKDGTIAPEMLYIAKLIGATCIVKAGGAQAIAAMAYGTESIPKVDKILGPGNQYVTAAKMILQNSEANISIDMPAGPSEVLVIADKQANPAFVASDLLSQAEHGPDSQVVLLSIKGFDTEALEQELEQQLNVLPRVKIAKQSIGKSYIVKVDTVEEAIRFSNLYAPEHLIINVENASDYSDNIMNAGSVFLGPWSPESVGDYASGTNHTLPTYGYAKIFSGVSLDTFLKFITFQELTDSGLAEISGTVMTMADVEKLHAHKNAVQIRINAIKRNT
ncbi:MAG TPA: histidinol dehydrogenase [Balneolales bacterium]|nr:histidinol dehydrogenase [Balneolales bacterium]